MTSRSVLPSRRPAPGAAWRAVSRASRLVALLGAMARAAVAQPAPPPVVAPARADTSSARTLTFEAFHRVVAANHPVARQAALARDQAREELRIAKGAFDPTVSGSMSRKRSSGALYYDYVDAEIKVPTPIGSDLKLGYERAIGDRIANDRYTGSTTGNNGIFTLGVSIPIGQRLLTDERRNALAQARALQDAAEADRAAAVNKLLLDAAKQYAGWYEAWRRRAVAGEGVSLAEFRLRGVRARVARGEAAAIDTIEALLEVQRRQVQRLEADQAYYAASLGVASFLWDERTNPVELAPDVAPTLAGIEAQPVDSALLPRWLEQAARRHPDLRKVGARVDQAAAQRTFQAQQLIPFVEASLASLAPQEDFGALTERARFDDNYKAGVSVRSPLLFMRERGRFNSASQRLEVQELEETRLRREIALEVRAAVNDLATVHGILELQRVAVRRARQLLAGEQRRFENGESQLLVVNLRERLVLEEELRLASLEAKYAGARAELAVALGEPGTLP